MPVPVYPPPIGGPPGPPGPPGPASAPNCYIYRLGAAAAGPVVFGTWAGLMAAMDAQRVTDGAGGGCYRILFDDSVTAVLTIPAGVYNMQNVEWSAVEDLGGAIGSTGFVQVTILDGARFTRLREMTGPLLVRNRNTVTSPIADLLNRQQVTLRNGVALRNEAGFVPFFNLATIGAGQSCFINLNAFCQLGATSGSISTLVSMPTVGSSLIVQMGVQTQVGINAMGAVAGSNLFVNFLASSVFYGRSQTAFLGTLFRSIQSDTRYNTKTTTAVAPVSALVNDFQPFDVTGGAIAQPMPAIATNIEDTTGMVYGVREVSGRAGLSVTPVGTDTINGNAGAFAIPGGSSYTFTSNGVGNWLATANQVGSPVVFGADSVGSAADTRFIAVGWDSGPAQATPDYAWAAPRAGVLRNFRVRHNEANGNGNAVAYDVLVNGVPQALGLSLATGAIGQTSNLTARIAVAAGDLVSVSATKAAGIGNGDVSAILSIEHV